MYVPPKYVHCCININEYQEHKAFYLVGFKQVQNLCYYSLHDFKHVMSFLFIKELEILLKI